MRLLLVAALILPLSSETALAMPPDGLPDGGLRALSPLMAGTMGGVACNRKIDWSVGGLWLRKQLGDKLSINADGISYVVWMAYAQQAMQGEFSGVSIGKVGRQKYCATITKGFGSGGDTIQGLISDD